MVQIERHEKHPRADHPQAGGHLRIDPDRDNTDHECADEKLDLRGEEFVREQIPPPQWSREEELHLGGRECEHRRSRFEEPPSADEDEEPQGHDADGEIAELDGLATRVRWETGGV